MKKLLQNALFIGVLFCSISSLAQENGEKITIKVKKDKLFIKAAFDDTEFKVIAFDVYGNPHEQAIKSFSIYYKEGKSEYITNVDGNTFPQKTINFLTKKKKEATKICLTKLKAETKDGHLEDLPDLCDIVIFPDCKKVNKTQ